MTRPIWKSPEGASAVRDVYLRLLEGWPVPHDRHFVGTRHGKTHVISSGPPDGPALVLLHGSAANSATWLADVETFSRSHRVHAVDLIGEPTLSDPPRPPLPGSAYADWLLDVLSGLEIERTSIVGISLGGWMALRFATLHADRVERLVLLCPGGVGPEYKRFLFRALFYLMLGKPGREAMLRYIYGNESVPQDVLDFSRLIAEHFRPRTGSLPRFTDEELAALVMPVKLILGARDVLLNSAETARRMQAHVPHIELEMDPDAGHVLIQRAEAIARFLNEPAE